MAPLALKLAKGEKLGSSKEEGYMPNGIRVNFFEDKRGSQRAVEMPVSYTHLDVYKRQSAQRISPGDGDVRGRLRDSHYHGYGQRGRPGAAGGCIDQD